jgi:hypothetical protein
MPTITIGGLKLQLHQKATASALFFPSVPLHETSTFGVGCRQDFLLASAFFMSMPPVFIFLPLLDII